jgi:glucose-6-phosphate isomerase
LSELTVDLEHARVARNSLTRHSVMLRRALERFDSEPEGDFLRAISRADLLREINSFVKGRAARLTDVVQLGIGGSSLGAQAVCGALLPARHNEIVRKPGLRCHFPDNIDPESFGALLESLNPTTTLVHVVSKSGGTLETAAQLHALLEVFRGSKRKFSMRKNFVVTTGASGALRDFASDEGVPVLSAPEHIAGRYSLFTSSGLLVPALCGVPVARVLAGARRMEQRCRADAMIGPAGLLAALGFHHDQNEQRPIHVEMIYSDALQLCGAWFSQIWAESLGKKGRGPTPVVARGTTDQHSQIQLYVGGPDDKLYTVVRVDRHRRAVKIARGARPAVLSGRSLAQIFAAEAEGTVSALIEQRRPVVQLRLPKITPEIIGELILLQQLQTALAGSLYRVDPFVQPGVEAGKIAAMKILSGGSPPG